MQCGCCPKIYFTVKCQLGNSILSQENGFIALFPQLSRWFQLVDKHSCPWTMRYYYWPVLDCGNRLPPPPLPQVKSNDLFYWQFHSIGIAQFSTESPQEWNYFAWTHIMESSIIQVPTLGSRIIVIYTFKWQINSSGRQNWEYTFTVVHMLYL